MDYFIGKNKGNVPTDQHPSNNAEYIRNAVESLKMKHDVQGTKSIIIDEHAYQSIVENNNFIDPIVFDEPVGLNATLVLPGVAIPGDRICENSKVVFNEDGVFMAGVVTDVEDGSTYGFIGGLNCPAIIENKERSYGLFIPFEEYSTSIISKRNAYIADTMIKVFSSTDETSIPDIAIDIDKVHELDDKIHKVIGRD